MKQVEWFKETECAKGHPYESVKETRKDYAVAHCKKCPQYDCWDKEKYEARISHR